MVSFGSGKKCVIYRLDIIFCITHVAQLLVSKINFFCQRHISRYLQRDLLKRNTKLHTMSGSWKMAVADCYVTLGQDIWRNCSLCLQKQVKSQTWGVSKKILSDIVRKDVAEFSDKFSYFRYATKRCLRGH